VRATAGSKKRQNEKTKRKKISKKCEVTKEKKIILAEKIK